MNPNTPYELNGILSTSPARDDYWQHIMNERYLLEISDKGGTTYSNISRIEGLKRLLPLIEKESNLIRISDLIYETPWSVRGSENSFATYSKSRGDFIVAKMGSNDIRDLYLKYFSWEVPPDFHPFKGEAHELSRLIMDAKEGKTEIKQFEDDFTEFLSFYTPSDGLFRGLRYLKYLLPSENKYHSIIDSLIKDCSLWSSPEALYLNAENDMWFHLNVEWLLSGFFYQGGKKVTERYIFTYFRHDVGLHIEKYIESVLSSAMTELDLRFLLLVIYTRSLPIFFPSWLGAPMMPLISNEDLNKLRELIAQSEVWTILSSSGYFNKYEKEAIALIGLDDLLRKDKNEPL